MEVARASASPWMLNPWKRILVGSKKRKANGGRGRSEGLTAKLSVF